MNRAEHFEASQKGSLDLASEGSGQGLHDAATLRPGNPPLPGSMEPSAGAQNFVQQGLDGRNPVSIIQDTGTGSAELAENAKLGWSPNMNGKTIIDTGDSTLEVAASNGKITGLRLMASDSSPKPYLPDAISSERGWFGLGSWKTTTDGYPGNPGNLFGFSKTRPPVSVSDIRLNPASAAGPGGVDVTFDLLEHPNGMSVPVGQLTRTFRPGVSEPGFWGSLAGRTAEQEAAPFKAAISEMFEMLRFVR